MITLKTRPLIVDVPFSFAFTDGYIDNMITVVLEKEDWVEKAINAGPLTIHSLFRPIDHRDPLPRDDAVSVRELKRKGKPSERKIVLGWMIDTNTFRIYLPKKR